MEGRALRPYPPVVVSFDGELAPASVENLTPIVVEWKRRDRRKQIISLPSDPDEDVESGTEFCVRHGPPGFETVTVLGTASETTGDFNLDFAGYSRIEIFARRDGYESTAFTFDTVAENGAGASVAGGIGTVAVTGVVEGAVTVEIEGELPTIDIQFTEPVELEVELPAAVVVTPVEGAVDTVVEITENFIVGVSALIEATVDISVEASGDIGTITATVPTVTLEAGANAVAGGFLNAIPALDIGEIIGSAEGEIVEPSATLATPLTGHCGRPNSSFSFSTASATRYCHLGGQLVPNISFAMTPYTTEGNWRREAAADGVIDKFAAVITTNSRTTDTVLTVRVNGVDTTQTVTIPASTTGRFVTTGDPVSVSMGDLLSVKIVSGAGTQTLVIAGLEASFEADEDVVSHHFVMGDEATNATPTTTVRGIPYNGTVEGNGFGLSYDQSVSTTNAYDSTVRTPGDIDRLRVYISSNTSSVDLVYTLYKNGSATGLTVTVPAGTAGVFENIGTIVSVVEDDRLHFRQSSSAGTGNFKLGWIQTRIVRTVAQYDVYSASRSSDTLQGYNDKDYYFGLMIINPQNVDDSPTSHTTHRLPTGGTVKKFLVTYNQSTSGSVGFNFTLRKNGANTAIVAAAGAGGAVSPTIKDDVNEVAFADGDRISVGFRTEVFSCAPRAWSFAVAAAA